MIQELVQEHWEYELPDIYDEETGSFIPNEYANKIIYFGSPSMFSIKVYENCLEILTNY